MVVQILQKKIAYSTLILREIIEIFKTGIANTQ